MFNLLMAYSGWNPSRDTVDKARVLEYTSDELQKRFLTGANKTLDLDAVTELPVLLTCESSPEAKPSRVARFTRVQLVGREYRVDYVIDPDIPPIPHGAIEALGAELGIGSEGSFEWSRSHWAIKEADLFQVLLKAGIGGAKLKPTGFQFSDERDAELVAVMMPFDRTFNDVYAAIKAAAKTVRMKCERADDIWEEDVVIQDVVNLICKARIVVCDLTDRNPNVFYEMGIAHSLGKDVVMITQNKGDVPFDVQSRRYLRYLHNSEGLTKMGEGLSSRFEKLLERR